jgi:hypothetical protein
MPTPVLRRDGTVAGGGLSTRREQIAAPVPPGTAYAVHCIARHLGLRTSEMVRLALAEFIESRADQLTPVAAYADNFLHAATSSKFRQGRPIGCKGAG